MKNFDIDTISIIIVAITNVLWLYLHCALGKFVTERYDELPDSLFDSKWYKLPNRLQKYFILLLSYTQEPLFFDGLGIYALNMGTFTTVSGIVNRSSSHIILNFPTFNSFVHFFVILRL